MGSSCTQVFCQRSLTPFALLSFVHRYRMNIYALAAVVVSASLSIIFGVRLCSEVNLDLNMVDIPLIKHELIIFIIESVFFFSKKKKKKEVGWGEGIRNERRLHHKVSYMYAGTTFH